ncbi:MAG: VWA domain-containing protein [Pseudomonadota bacterium]
MAHDVLLDFIRAARGAGVRISTAESLDALRAVDLVGYGSRSRLHDTLSLALAKSSAEKPVFDETFERFFTASRLSGLGDPDRRRPDDAEIEPRQGAGSTPGSGSGSGGGGLSLPQPASPLGQLLMQGDANALAVALAQAAQRINLDNLRLFTQRGLFGRRLIQEMGGEALDLEIIAADTRAEEGGDAGARALAAELKRRRQLLRDEIREFIDRQYLLQAAQANRALREDMIREANLATLGEFRNVEVLVRKLARKLATQHSRRRRIEKRGLLDVRRTLRRNVRHDGVLFEPQWRWKRMDRPNVVVVCDVSNSVRAYAKFLLLFLYSLADVLPRVRAFAFSFRLGEVTELFRTQEFPDAVQVTLDTWGVGSTDYGLAFESLEELCYDAVDHRTTLIVLGDARSNYGEPRVDILKRFSERVRQVIWLNPEHPGRWGGGDSVMPRYRPYCTYAESTRTLADLEKVVSRILRRA